MKSQASKCTHELSKKRIKTITKKVIGTRTQRDVVIALPEGKVPKNGWPAVVYYQGSFFKSSFNWPKLTPKGGHNESLMFKKLLAEGFAVIIPRAEKGIAWSTNAMLFRGYEASDDFAVITNMLAAVKDGDFGPINTNKLFAAGMSSGGYNTSRMAVSFPGVFKGLMIHSASYATCLGPVKCSVPKSLPKDHPPTLFIHGALDLTVPAYTMKKYAKSMENNGIAYSVFIKTTGAHGYFKETPLLTVNWFKDLL